MFLEKLFAVLLTAVFFLWCPSPLFAQTSEEDEEIKVDVALVNVPFSVSDREGRSILGLKAENFAFFEDGKKIDIEYLSTQDAPLNVVLLLDTSHSALATFDKIKFAASEFIKQLRPQDKCMIVSFDSAARVKSEFTSDQKKMAAAIKRTALSQKPGTLLRDAISVIVNKELGKVKGRKAIILITDGKDAGSLITERELLYLLAEADAPIYSILYETVPPILSPTQKKSKEEKKIKYDKKKLKQYAEEQNKKNVAASGFTQKMSELTGGRSYVKEIDNLGEAFNLITEELRKQYLITFYPEDANYNIAQHRIKITVNQKNAVIRLKNYSLLK